MKVQLLTYFSKLTDKSSFSTIRVFKYAFIPLAARSFLSGSSPEEVSQARETEKLPDERRASSQSSTFCVVWLLCQSFCHISTAWKYAGAWRDSKERDVSRGKAGRPEGHWRSCEQRLEVGFGRLCS